MLKTLSLFCFFYIFQEKENFEEKFSRVQEEFNEQINNFQLSTIVPSLMEDDEPSSETKDSRNLKLT